jgi:Fe-S-cluster containining protein
MGGRSERGAEPHLAAGDFGVWLSDMRAVLRGEGDADVPCGQCTACCTASQFIHVGPDETDTLAHIPAELLFPAPGLPRGHVLMGYDERGHCPMLVDGRCSIYAHRPRTCRTYDCRVFAATGIEPDAGGDADKSGIAGRAREWFFGFPSATDRASFDAVRVAAAAVAQRTAIPATPTQHAVLAIEIHEDFLSPETKTAETLDGTPRHL